MVRIVHSITLVVLLVLTQVLAELPVGSLHGHLTFAEITNWVRDQILPNYPTISKLYEIGKSVEGRPIFALCLGSMCTKVGFEFTGEALYTALHHAREPLGMMAIATFADDLLTKFRQGDMNVIHLLNRRRLFFIFTVNPDGYVANERGSGMRRKNMGNHGKTCPGGPLNQNGDSEFGVDLNRNYDFCFDEDNVGSSANPCAIDYKGPSPFSEPETKAMKKFIEEMNFGVAFNYHSFGKEVYIPFSCKAKGFTHDDKFFREYAKRLTKSNGYKYGQPWGEGLYTVNGDAADWMYATRGIFAVSPEVAPADPVKSEHDGFWVDDSVVPKMAKETLDMNYVGAWTSGSYLEVSLVASQASVKLQVYNWGLLPHRGGLQGVFHDPKVAITKKLFPMAVYSDHLPVHGEKMKEIELDGIVLRDNATIAIKDEADCLVYQVMNQRLTLMYRVSYKDLPCVMAFASLPAVATEAPVASTTNYPSRGPPAKTSNNPQEPIIVFGSIALGVLLLVGLACCVCCQRKPAAKAKFQHLATAVAPDQAEESEDLMEDHDVEAPSKPPKPTWVKVLNEQVPETKIPKDESVDVA